MRRVRGLCRHLPDGRADELDAHITFAVSPGELFATFHTTRASLNRVTGPRRDPSIKTPEYMLAAVRVGL